MYFEEKEDNQGNMWIEIVNLTTLDSVKFCAYRSDSGENIPQM